MAVEIDDGNAAIAKVVLEAADRDDDVVKRAESAGTVVLSVMQATSRIKRSSILSACHEARGEDRSSHGERGASEDAGPCWRISIVEESRAARIRGTDVLEVRDRVNSENLFIGWRRRDYLGNWVIGSWFGDSQLFWWQEVKFAKEIASESVTSPRLLYPRESTSVKNVVIDKGDLVAHATNPALNAYRTSVSVMTATAP